MRTTSFRTKKDPVKARVHRVLRAKGTGHETCMYMYMYIHDHEHDYGC